MGLDPRPGRCLDGVTLRDVMVLIAGTAFGMSLLRLDAEPPPEWQAWGSLIRDPGLHPLASAVVIAWYVLLGPTLAGPILAIFHRGQWSRSTGFKLWVVLGVLTWGYIGMFYVPGHLYCMAYTRNSQFHHDHPSLAHTLRQGFRAGGTAGMLLGLVVPVLVPVLAAVARRRSRGRASGSLNWFSVVGWTLGSFWALRDIALIYVCITDLGAFIRRV